MPVYEYECKGCEKILEIKQKMADDPLKVCPECGSEVKKLMSMSSFQLKGGGWYADGYSSSSKKAETEKPAACPASSNSGGGCAGCPAASSQ